MDDDALLLFVVLLDGMISMGNKITGFDRARSLLFSRLNRSLTCWWRPGLRRAFLYAAPQRGQTLTMKLSSAALWALCASSASAYSVSRSDLRTLGQKTVRAAGKANVGSASMKMEGKIARLK